MLHADETGRLILEFHDFCLEVGVWFFRVPVEPARLNNLEKVLSLFLTDERNPGPGMTFPIKTTGGAEAYDVL